MTTGTRMTAEELLWMPDDGYRYELVRGELVQFPFAECEHGYVAMNVGTRLAKYVETNNAILTKDEELDGKEVVPGWTLKVSDLFA